jgi:hypothetical protein
MKIFLKHSIFLFILFFVILPVKAHAYLDPSTGSYLLQIAAAAFFGATYVIATWWRQIKLFIVRILGKDKKTSEKTSTKEK